MVNYNDIGYQNLRHEDEVMQGSWEGLIHDAVGMLESGKVRRNKDALCPYTHPKHLIIAGKYASCIGSASTVIRI